jgi:hypothetical protein
MVADPACPAWVDAFTLATPLAQLLGARAVVDDWTCQRLSGFGRGIGTWRLRGDAMVAGRRHGWALVLKGWAPTEGSATPAAWDWPHREAELYLSGALAALPPGIRAPRCLHSLTRNDGTIWIWLEDLGDTCGHPRTIVDYAITARHLGQLNGAYLAGRPLPEGRGLDRTWLAAWVEAAAPEMALLLDGIDHPRMRAVYPPEVVEAFGALWTSRHVLLDRLGRLPATFCHRDAFGRNLFHPAENEETIAIDWEFAGFGFAGEDLTPLVAATALFMDIASDDIERLERTAFAAYLKGLRAAGWAGDPADIHAAYAISAALRFGVGMARMIVPFMLSDEQIADWASEEGTTETETVTEYAAINRWLCALADTVVSGGSDPTPERARGPRPGDVSTPLPDAT